QTAAESTSPVCQRSCLWSLPYAQHRSSMQGTAGLLHATSPYLSLVSLDKTHTHAHTHTHTHTQTHTHTHTHTLTHSHTLHTHATGTHSSILGSAEWYVHLGVSLSLFL